MTQKYNKPIPSPQGESDLYWNKAEEKELWIRKCNKCDEGYFYPRDISPCCFQKILNGFSAQEKPHFLHMV
ncbi:MAG: hypothetical protein CM1200mP38_4310 [Dehalococcoidia bacterium]|nr:MAG: hypothetical protein CM1200mP38_4310 [Dehalococcoidia bacterium]